jgi:xylan 1,4-beta-xylosidase
MYRITGVPGRQITITEYRLDREHANSDEAWKKMGSPQNPTAAQIKELEEAAELKTTGKGKKMVNDGNVGLSITLPRQGVLLLCLDW